MGGRGVKACTPSTFCLPACLRDDPKGGAVTAARFPTVLFCVRVWVRGRGEVDEQNVAVKGCCQGGMDGPSPWNHSACEQNVLLAEPGSKSTGSLTLVSLQQQQLPLLVVFVTLFTKYNSKIDV